MDTILKWSGVVALVILATIYGSTLIDGSTLGSSTNCTDGYSCLTNFEVQGIQVNDGVLNLNKSTFCLNFYATSTATRTHLTASTTGTLPVGSAGVITMDYGACS